MAPRLTTLKSQLQTVPSRLQGLALRPSVERKRGSAGVKDRQAIKRRDCGLCQECVKDGRPGPGWLVDHIVPLWAGGSDDGSNKQLLCKEHHDAKTAREAAERARG